MTNSQNLNPDIENSQNESLLTERSPSEQSSLRIAFFKILVLFSIGTLVLFGVFKLAPPLSEAEKKHVKLPKTMDDARNLGNVLETYTDEYFGQVIYCYFTTYIFLQTFSIPGSVFLSVLAGYLFNTWLAMFFVCLCSAIEMCFEIILLKY